MTTIKIRQDGDFFIYDTDGDIMFSVVENVDPIEQAETVAFLLGIEEYDIEIFRDERNDNILTGC